jgi:hypothetical protein
MTEFCSFIILVNMKPFIKKRVSGSTRVTASKQPRKPAKAESASSAKLLVVLSEEKKKVGRQVKCKSYLSS